MGSTFKQQLRREQFRLKDLSLSLSQQAVSSPVTAAEFGQAYLCIATPSEKSIANLSDQSQLYIDNLKIYLLRILARTPALNYLNDRINYNLTEIFDFLGFDNFEAYRHEKSFVHIKQDLEHVLSLWETGHDPLDHLPPALKGNLGLLAATLALTALEQRVLAFIILTKNESLFETTLDLVGDFITSHHLSRHLSAVLSLPIQEIDRCLSPESNLVRSGLLLIEQEGRGTIESRLNFLTRSFAQQMLMQFQNPFELMRQFVSPVLASKLNHEHYTHIQARVSLIQTYLAQCLASQKVGINVLIYGPPGTGKTQLALLLAQALQVRMMQVSASALDGHAQSPILRLRSQRIAQQLFAGTHTLLLFDECEEVFTPIASERNAYGNKDDTAPQKSWINHMLESNACPTIWIANSVESFDPAYIRRFDISFEMPYPTTEQKMALFKNAFSVPLPRDVIRDIAQHPQTSPALIDQVAKVLRSLPPSELHHPQHHAIELVNDKLVIDRTTPIPHRAAAPMLFEVFEPAYFNCKFDVEILAANLHQHPNARLCVFGPPGTGKTAFAHWLAHHLQRPTLHKKASELMGSFVGETERNIALAFRQATQQKAILHIDEIDSFLVARDAHESLWQVTMVNEFLTQMDGFSQTLIVSTNRFEALDEAALRRFDMSIELGSLTFEQSQQLLERLRIAFKLGPLENQDLKLLSRLQGLTMGDFQQLWRRSHLIRPLHAHDLVLALQNCRAQKKNLGHAPLGFLNPDRAIGAPLDTPVFS